MITRRQREKKLLKKESRKYRAAKRAGDNKTATTIKRDRLERVVLLDPNRPVKARTKV